MTNVTTKLNVRFTWETTHAKKDSRHVHITESVEVHDKKVLISIEVMYNDIITLFILGKHKMIYSVLHYVHIGSTPQSGHYVTYARTAERWYEFDDALVSFFLIQCQYYEISC